MLVQQRQREPGAVAEAAVQRAGADARRAGDVVHRDVLDAALVHQLRGRRQDAQAVAGGVRPLVRRLAVVELRELEHGVHHAGSITPIARPATPPRAAGRPARRPSRLPSSGSPSEPSNVEGRVGHPDRQLGFERVRARRLERLADLRLRPDGAEQAGARPDHRGRLLAQHVVGERARGPVERVLEPAGDRRVVLGGGDQEAVGLLDRGEELLHRRRRGVLEVLIEDGQAGEALPLHELDSGREHLARRPEQPPVVGAPAHAARYAEDPHLATPARRARARRSG